MQYDGKFLQDPQHILFEVRDDIAWITLNRPEKRNAMSPDMLEELDHAVHEADARSDIKVIVLQGAGRDFCAGYDLAGTYSGRADEAAAKQRGQDMPYRTLIGTFDDDIWNMEQSQQRLLSVYNAHKPVLVKVQGNCMAGGIDLMLYCDLVIVADDARIGYPATRVNGFPPSFMWVYHLGPQWTKRQLFTGDSLSGRDAVHLGMALESHPAEELDEAVDALARRIALADPELLSTHKRMTNLALEHMGAVALQKQAIEADARCHHSTGSGRVRFKENFAAGGLKAALTGRDAPYGDSVVKLRRS